MAQPAFRRELADTMALIRAKAPREALEPGVEPDFEVMLAQARELIVARLAAGAAEGGR